MFSGCCPIVGFFAHQVSHSGKLRIVLCEIIMKIEITLHTGEEGGFYDRKGGGESEAQGVWSQCCGRPTRSKNP